MLPNTGLPIRKLTEKKIKHVNRTGKYGLFPKRKIINIHFKQNEDNFYKGSVFRDSAYGYFSRAGIVRTSSSVNCYQLLEATIHHAP